MKPVRVVTFAALLVMLAGCGLKRDLELPGHEKHKNKTNAQDTTTGQVPAAPAITPAAHQP